MWILLSVSTGGILNQTSQMMTPWTWWPDLMFDLCILACENWDVGDWILEIKRRPECRGYQGCTLPQAYYPNEPGYSHVLRRHAFLQAPFYVCPGSNQTASTMRNCKGAPYYYYSSWGCEQTRQWIKQHGDKIPRSPKYPYPIISYRKIHLI